MAFGFYTPFTIATGQVPSSQSNFAALIAPASDTRFKTVGNGGHVQNSSGFDIRPYSDSSLTTALDFELEANSYSPTAGTFTMWVKITAVDSQVVYLAYGDSGISTDGSSGANTFSNSFTVVLHMGTSSSMSTTNSVDGATATNTSVTASAGKIGGAGSWSATSGSGTSKLDYGDNYDITASPYTFSAWLNPNTLFNGNIRIIDKRGGTGLGYIFGVSESPSEQDIWVQNDSTNVGSGLNTFTTTGSWSLIGAVWDGSTVTFYKNGSSIASPPSLTANPSGTTASFCIGNRGNADTTTYDGLIDELHVATATRTANWMTTEFNNQTAPNTFWSIGTEVAVSTDTLLGQSVF